MSNDVLKKMANELQNSDMETLRSNIDDLDKALELDDFIVKAKLPEYVFKDTFLPIIAGKEQDNGILMLKYIEYAGGPYKEVDIVDKDGKTIFTCPPIYNRSDIKHNNAVPYSQIASTYELKRARIAAEATNYMNNVSVGISRSISIEENSNTFKWGKIVDRYYNNDNTKDNETTTSNVSNNNNTIDDNLINYD